ncbi:hypothetical protein D3C81_1908460 [compost metagenome]
MARRPLPLPYSSRPSAVAPGASATNVTPTATSSDDTSAVHIGWRLLARICKTREATWLGPSNALSPIAVANE